MVKPLKYGLMLAVAMVSVGIAFAGDGNANPQKKRQDVMENVGKAAKPVGLMFRGELDYDADQVMASLQVFHDAAESFGGLFPAGSETGEKTEAAPAIWEDRDGFNQALADFLAATDSAIAAAPQSLDEARASVGPIFKTCKGCHDDYRIKEE